jgi:hypothetical protein
MSEPLIADGQWHDGPYVNGEQVVGSYRIDPNHSALISVPGDQFTEEEIWELAARYGFALPVADSERIVARWRRAANNLMQWPDDAEGIGADTPAHPGTTTEGFDHEHNLAGTCFPCVERIGRENPGALDGIMFG